MLLDEMTRRNLELVEPLRAGEEGGTLTWVLDETVTAMGARALRRWNPEPFGGCGGDLAKAGGRRGALRRSRPARPPS